MMDLSNQMIVNRAYNGDEGVTFLTLARWLVLVSLTVALLLVSASIRTEIRSLEYSIEQARSENRRLAESGERLRAEWEALTSPARLADAAGELGLIPADQPDVLVLQGAGRSESPAGEVTAGSLALRSEGRE